MTTLKLSAAFIMILCALLLAEGAKPSNLGPLQIRKLKNISMANAANISSKKDRRDLHLAGDNVPILVQAVEDLLQLELDFVQAQTNQTTAQEDNTTQIDEKEQIDDKYTAKIDDKYTAKIDDKYTAKIDEEDTTQPIDEKEPPLIPASSMRHCHVKRGEAQSSWLLVCQDFSTEDVYFQESKDCVVSGGIRQCSIKV